MERDDKVYVHNIIDAIVSVESFIQGINTVDDFVKPENKKTQSAVIRELEVIGEAAKQLTERFRSRESELPWGKIVAMRNKLMHEYWDIDLRIVWKTIYDHLDILKRTLLEYLKEHGE